MNANETAYELADRIEKEKGMPYTVKMLRQQADRIAELKNVSSKPVAEVIEWEETYGHTFKKRTVSTVKWLENVEVGTKLYTHPVKQLSDEEIIEKLAELEHRQWMMWATNIVSTEEISKERKDRWFTCMVAYSELSEEMKEHDRVWARQALAIIKEITDGNNE